MGRRGRGKCRAESELRSRGMARAPPMAEELEQMEPPGAGRREAESELDGKTIESAIAAILPGLLAIACCSYSLKAEERMWPPPRCGTCAWPWGLT